MYRTDILINLNKKPLKSRGFNICNLNCYSNRVKGLSRYVFKVCKN